MPKASSSELYCDGRAHLIELGDGEKPEVGNALEKGDIGGLGVKVSMIVVTMVLVGSCIVIIVSGCRIVVVTVTKAGWSAGVGANVRINGAARVGV